MGGSPVKSNVARRIRVRRSAGGAGGSPFASSFARRKRSIGLRTCDGFRVIGTAGSRTGWNAQWSDRIGPARGRATTAVSAFSSGSGAPRFTHSSSNATSDCGSLLSGGIFDSPAYFTDWTRRLPFGLPDTTTGPLSPPLRMPSRVSRSSPPFTFSAWAEWHL